MLTRRHWIFDLDGTLTLAVHDFAALRVRLGLPPGAPILEAIEAAPPARRAWLSAEVAAWEREAVAAATPAPDALPLLDHLAEGGYRVGILTRNLRGVALDTLAACGLAARFAPELVLGREEAEAKPSPAGVQRLLSAWGADPEDAVMIGDYVYDLAAGRAAGVATVHIARAGEAGWPALTDVRVERLDGLLGRGRAT